MTQTSSSKKTAAKKRASTKKSAAAASPNPSPADGSIVAPPDNAPLEEKVKHLGTLKVAANRWQSEIEQHVADVYFGHIDMSKMRQLTHTVGEYTLLFDVSRSKQLRLLHILQHK